MNEMAWKDALAFKPDIVVIKLGTNDSKPQNWQHSAEFKHDMLQMITSLRPNIVPQSKKKARKKAVTDTGSPKIFICTPIPAFKSSWNINETIIKNEIIPIEQEVAREYGLQVIDLHTLFADGEELVQPDGIHPNEKGVQRMAEAVAAAIAE
jgi:lysophospholipase L1-like esterase